MSDRPNSVTRDRAVGERDAEAHRLAAAVLILLAAGVCAIVMATVVATGYGLPSVLISGALLVPATGLPLWHARTVPAPPGYFLSRAALHVQVVLTYLPFAFFGATWASVPAFLSASVLLVLPSPRRWVAFALVAAGDVVATRAVGLRLDHAVYVAVATSVIGLVGYCLVRLATAARTEVRDRASDTVDAEAAIEDAVLRERRRIDRDLHDLVGQQLSSVILKTELASRLIVTDPDAAQRELAEVIVAARRALADVRAVTYGHRRLSLAAETASARAVLEKAGIECDLTVALGPVPPAVSDVLATVLREAVTNVVRHSNARRCRIAVTSAGDQARLAVVNDGAPPMSRTTGSGIASLSEQVFAAGGNLAVRHHAGWFELVVTIDRDPDVR